MNITYSMILDLVQKQIGTLYCNLKERFPKLDGKKFYFAEHHPEDKKVILYSEYKNKKIVLASYKYDTI